MPSMLLGYLFYFTQKNLLILNLNIFVFIIIISLLSQFGDLIISIFKEVLPNINIHQDWRDKYYLYKSLDDLQQKYLIQYINKING